MAVFVNQDFELLNTPLKETPNGTVPPFAGDIGNGASPTVSQMWVIAVDDDPALNRLPPMGFIQGSKCVWGRLEPDPAWSTECFLMRTPDLTTKLYVKWYEAFRWLKPAYVPVFWNFTRRTNNATGDIMYTLPMAKIWLSNGSLSSSADPDSGLNFDHPTVYTHQIKALTWHLFEFYYEYGDPGKWWLKLDGSLALEFNGKTLPSMAGFTYRTDIIGFEVGMQSTWLDATDYREFWLDSILAQDIIPGIVTHILNVNSIDKYGNPITGISFTIRRLS